LDGNTELPVSVRVGRYGPYVEQGERRASISEEMPPDEMNLAMAVELLAKQELGDEPMGHHPDTNKPIFIKQGRFGPYVQMGEADDEDKKNAIAASQIALVKSGTVALEVAMANIPMIVTYKVHPLSAWYLRRKLLIKNANLINILIGEDVIPEMLQELCDPVMIATACAHLLTDLGRQENQKSKEKIALEKLLLPDGKMPSDVAAKTILSLVAPVFTNS
jgi:hypothetical protein